MAKFYAKNPSNTSIVRLLTLGIDIPVKSTINLLDHASPYILGNDLELMQRVISGIIIINNGISDMTPTQAIAYINGKADYESSKLSDLILTFGEDSKYYWENKKKEYRICRRFHFKGAQSLGYPIACKIVSNIEDDKYDGVVHLYDYTNDNILCDLTVASEEPLIYTTTEFQNFPENEVILDLRAKTNKDGKFIHVYSMSLIF